MKKTLHILLTVLYLSFTIGIFTSNTFCLGKVSSDGIAFNNYSGSSSCDCCCSCCDGSCCVDEIKTFKIEDNYNLSTVDFNKNIELLFVLKDNSLKDLTYAKKNESLFIQTINMNFPQKLYLQSSVLII